MIPDPPASPPPSLGGGGPAQHRWGGGRVGGAWGMQSSPRGPQCLLPSPRSPPSAVCLLSPLSSRWLELRRSPSWWPPGEARAGCGHMGRPPGCRAGQVLPTCLSWQEREDSWSGSLQHRPPAMARSWQGCLGGSVAAPFTGKVPSPKTHAPEALSGLPRPLTFWGSQGQTWELRPPLGRENRAPNRQRLWAPKWPRAQGSGAAPSLPGPCQGPSPQTLRIHSQV